MLYNKLFVSHNSDEAYSVRRPGEIMTTKRRFIKHLPLLLAGFALGLGVFSYSISNKQPQAQETTATTDLNSYYSGVNGTGAALLSSIADVIGYDSDSSKNKIRDIGYDGLKAAYAYTDVRNDGYLRDIYSDNTRYTPGSNFVGNYSDVGDGYNREHVIPKSWWGHTGSSNPTKQGSDLYIVLPSDAKANGMRSNYPYGLTNSTDMYKLSNDPVGNKLGSSSNTSYVSGTVFEPFEDRKGDIARIYFYAAAAYKKGGANNGAVTTWTSGDGAKVFASNGKNGFVQNYLNLLLKWHKDDPVSQFEIDRNENVQTKTNQGNRNPFVDHPSWVDLIWGGTYTGAGAEDTSSNNVINGQLSPSGNPYLTSISVNTAPTKTSYTAGEYFDPTGLIINRVYSDSSLNDTYTYAGHTSEFTFSPSTSTALTTSHTSVTITYGGKPTTQAITVTSSSGSGGSGSLTGEYSLYSGALTEGDYLITYENKAMNTTVSNSRLQYTAISPTNNVVNVTDESIVFHIAQCGSYWTLYNAAYNSSSGGYAAATNTYKQAQMLSSADDDLAKWSCSSNAQSETYEFENKGRSESDSNNTYKYLRENSTYGYALYTGSTGGELTLYKKVQSGGSNTLSSISVSTAPTKTIYTVGEYFNPEGLVITRSYSNNTSDTYSYADHTSEFIFTPSTSTALTTSNKSISIGYGGKTCSQAITVNAAAPTSIVATVSKSFCVGETISSSDITVKDNNNNTISSFVFSNDGYQFTYSDAASGGESTSKTFTNSISYSTLQCNLTVSVSRLAYVAPAGEKTDTITASDLTATSTSYSDFSGVTKTSGAVYAGQSAKDSSGNIQLRSNNSNSGIISTSTGGNIKSVTINVGSGSNTVNVYGKNTAYSSAGDLFNNSKQGTKVGSLSATGTISFSTSYKYVGICSNSGAVYLSSVAITYGLSETSTNVANYIMYEDTNNQCKTKLTTAIGYLNNLSNSDRADFLSESTDYCVVQARARLNAWAASQGKTITTTVNGVELTNNPNIQFIVNNENNNTFIVLIIISMVGISSIGACLYIRKKRSS